MTQKTTQPETIFTLPNSDDIVAMIFMAVSVDGFIAGPENQTPWTAEEWANYKTYLDAADCLIVGRRTFELMYAAKEFDALGQPNTIVVSGASIYEHTLCAASVDEALRICEGRGWHKIIFGGGTQLNSSVLEHGYAQYLHLDIEPVIMGGGIPLFTKMPMQELELVNSEVLASGTLSWDYKIGEKNA